MNLINNELREAQGRGVVDPPLKRAMQEATRREKRRLLDAQRGKCRVRLGSHLDEWCALKDRLGFSLHSQLAKFLLDSYKTSTNPGTQVPKAITLLSVSIPSLHRLALLCHQHGRNCNSPPTILAQPSSTEASETPVLLWGCNNHQFHWDPHDYSTGLGGNSTEKDITNLSSMQQNRTGGQEKVLKITAELEIEPHSTYVQEKLSGKQSSSDTSSKTCPDNSNVHPQQCNDGDRKTECTSEEGRHITPEIKGPMKTKESKEQQELTVSDEGFCQSIQLELPVFGDSDVTGHQCVQVSEDIHESISRDITKKKPATPSFGRACRHQRTPNQFSQSYQQALMSESKTSLSCPCRRSPRGNKGCRTKAVVKEQVSQFKVELPSSVAREIGDVKGQDVNILFGSAPNTNLSNRISHVQESLPEDVTRQKTPSENFKGLAAVEEHQESPPAESQNDNVLMSRASGEEEQKTQMEPHKNEGQEPQSSQSRGLKTSCRKSLIDEELAQICKKRIRKAAKPQELLMCEYDNCGKIFSKRQYLNYHQKYQHMNQRTFCCSVTECGKTFNFKKHLKEHEKRHSDQRDFICEFCARAFRSSSNLIIHRRIHTGEKPLQCEFCGFTCRQKASLNWHMKKHDADSFYNFPCDICGQRFEKRDNLAAHKSRKHPAPRETGPQDISQRITSPMDNACQAEASCKNDHTERLTKDFNQKMAPTSPGSAKETLFPEYLDLPQSVQEVPQTPEVSLVIVV
ncbi:zinc finger protein 692-like isoform X2 [Hyla sarda]|uniref:zinc finger protein 692-like isoform X2 n=1 Tax=Hyla sarda TaxID=327740 RepID=UPI0024C321D8|nr:zinc finger protein 692-like isoform X2 [Hyla sarda]